MFSVVTRMDKVRTEYIRGTAQGDEAELVWTCAEEGDTGQTVLNMEMPGRLK